MALRQRKALSSFELSGQNGEKKTSHHHEKIPSKPKVWLLASRPHTLTASIAPVIVATSLVKALGGNAAEHIQYDSYVFAAFACFIQLGTNLHNDYADFVKGADDDKRGKCNGSTV
jgi:1,4-dihydroxy-2-naphthoate octaprenyltransferase